MGIAYPNLLGKKGYVVVVVLCDGDKSIRSPLILVKANPSSLGHIRPGGECRSSARDTAK